MDRKYERINSCMHFFVRRICGDEKEREELLEMMHPDIWIWNEDGCAFNGAEASVKEIKTRIPASGRLWKEAYHELYQGEHCCVVAGTFQVSTDVLKEGNKPVLVHITAIWVNLNRKPLLRHMHLCCGGQSAAQNAAETRKGTRCGGRYEIKDTENKIHHLRDLDILYIESRKNYMIWHCRKADVVIRGTMAYYQNHMSFAFLRIHRSFIVNINYVVKIQRCELKIMNGDVLQIPVKKYCRVRDQILKSPFAVLNG